METVRMEAERDRAVLSTRAIGYASYNDEAYPPLLRELFDPPYLLFYRGRLPDPEKPLAAVVGTRMPSPQASAQAFDLARGLGRYGMPVVSGLALGIDSMAHRGNLEGGGRTVAVLGSAVDEVYPASNRPLARRIVEQGGLVLSEYPPGTGPKRYHFPARNRIIAGLARGVVIVEAPAVSGALITAQFALDLGKDLWVASAGLGGGNLAALRAGTAKLAADGAGVVSSAEQILGEWGLEIKTIGIHNGAMESGPRFSGKDLASSLARSLNIDFRK
jgi:DNA processing protein